MLNFNSLMIGSEQPKVLGEFYEKVLGKKPEMASEDKMFGFMVGNAFLSIIEHSKVHGSAKEPERVIINFETKEVENEFERIKGLGATVVQDPYEIEGMKIATFADPDGNYFQLMPPWEGEK